MASAADSFLGKCISSKCGSITVLPGGVGAQVTSAVGFYEGYCTKVRLEVTDATTTPSPSDTGTRSLSKGVAVTAQATGGTTSGGVATGATSAGTTSVSGNGLGKSDVIALGVGLGVGVPSLVLAGATLWINMKRRKESKVEQH
jgi:hypothetical protein